MEFKKCLDDFERDGEFILEQQAECLPAGWVWHDYSDGSGHLQGPDGKRHFHYDLDTYANLGWVEYKNTFNSAWEVFQGEDGECGLDIFKRFCEGKIRQSLQLDRLSEPVCLSRYEIHELISPHYGYCYSVQEWQSVDGGKRFSYCGRGTYCRTIREAEDWIDKQQHGDAAASLDSLCCDAKAKAAAANVRQPAAPERAAPERD